MEGDESCDNSISTIFKNESLEETKENHEFKEPFWKYRYVVTMIGFVVYFYATFIRLNMSINLLAMVNNTAVIHQMKAESDSCPNLVNNITEEKIDTKMEGEFNWSPKTQGYIQGSYYFAYAATQVPTAFLAERYGCIWILFGILLVTGLCTLMIPPFSYLSANAVMVLQMLRGLAQSVLQPVSAILAANWFPKLERGYLCAFMHAGAPLGSFLGSLFSGYISDSSAGWTTSFYVAGAGGIIIALSVLYFVAESPKVHPRISKAELHFILCNQENVLSKRRPKVPWSKILKSVHVYALMYAYFGNTWALLLFLSVYSNFLATILHYPIGQNGLLSAVPFSMQFLGTQTSIWITFYMQKKKVVGVDFLRKFWTLIAALGSSACLLGVYFSGCNRTSSVLFAILSAGCTGMAFAGCVVVANDMTPTFAGTIQATACSIGFLASSLLPVVTGYLTDEMQTIEQWNKVFFISIGVILSSGIAFAIFGSAEVQPWNFLEEDASVKDDKECKNTEENAENGYHKEQTRF